MEGRVSIPSKNSWMPPGYGPSLQWPTAGKFPIGAHDEGIAAVDEPLEVHVQAEVSGIGHLTGTIARLQRVARVNKAVGIGVTYEDAHANSYVAGVGAIVHAG